MTTAATSTTAKVAAGATTRLFATMVDGVDGFRNGGKNPLAMGRPNREYQWRNISESNP